MKKRLKSFAHAFRGVSTLLSTQTNARIHFTALISVITLGFVFKVSSVEWVLLILTSTAVLAAEAFNSSIEFLCDYSSAEYHANIKKTKDLAAAGVLITSIGALVVGVLIFLPHFIDLFKQ